MEIFIGSFVVFALSALALLLGSLLRGRPLRPGCGQKKADCPGDCGNKGRCRKRNGHPLASPEA